MHKHFIHYLSMFTFLQMFIIIILSLLSFLPNYTISHQHSSILTKNKTALHLDEAKGKKQIGALHEIMLNDQNITTGHWFNKGMAYKKCVQSLQHDKGYFEKQLKDCEKYSGRMSMDKIDLIKPDYEALVKKVVCVIQKINCPVNERSFQIHDIPCQSSCLSLLSVCGQLRNYPPPNFKNIPSGCPMRMGSAGPRSQKRWLQEGDQYSRTPPLSYPSETYNTFSNLPNPRRYVRYPGYPAYLSSRSPSVDNHYKYQKQYNAQSEMIPNTYPWIYRRHRREMTSSSDEYQVDNSKTPVGHPDQYISMKTQLHFSPSYHNQRSLPLTEEDCLFLPPGGCDKWIDQSTNIQRLEAPTFREYLKMNPGCPSDITEKCNSMFPTTFTRNQWLKSNFTVAAIIRISGTLWWFGKNDHYQPLFRFHVLKTFDSDIHPYDENMILTYSWPLKCICMDEIIVGKKYLMLTHSFQSRQTLHITPKTVFLSRVRRYTKRLACWKGACTHRSNQKRRPRAVPSLYNRIIKKSINNNTY
ncbi:unnamed protein product [Trichobilharzia szidati]|nr:unnamed protein product [Trichobilharzia szidati]